VPHGPEIVGREKRANQSREETGQWIGGRPAQIVEFIVREETVVGASIQQNEGGDNGQCGRRKRDLLPVDVAAKRRRFGVNRCFDPPILSIPGRYNRISLP
jgi:hypothetical protein